MSKILIIEDNLVFARALKNWLEKEHFQVEYATNATRARRMITDNGDADLILSDMRLPDGDGVEMLEWLNKRDSRIPFVVMTQYAEVQSAVKAMKLGAVDYLPKPFMPETLYSVINGLLHRKKKVPTETHIFKRMSAKIQQVEKHTKLVAATDMSVLVRGENGTGKEYFAESIHKRSHRAGMPFIAVDCGAIPKDLAASEFFGHIKGAFTGALDNKNGVFYEADGGTLFLDEVGNLPYEVQILLLRVLQERSYRPVGGKREMKCDVRIVAATNENLEKAIADGRFREDLYYRLNEFTINIPPLRECPDDILPLAEFFLSHSVEELKREPLSLSAEAKKRIQVYDWPGNVRELKNTIRRAALIAEGKAVSVDDFGLAHRVVAKPASDDEDEREKIIKALEATQYNKTRAAEKLNMHRSTLHEKLKKYGIEAEK